MVQIQEAPLRVPDLDTEFDVSISCVICDTPARAYVKRSMVILAIMDVTSVVKKVCG